MESKKGVNVSILMYHYVREPENGSFPRLKGVDVEQFRHQVNHLSDNYEMVSVEDLLDALSGKITIPAKAVLLTFDDGYIDHFVNVFPLLKEKRIPGAFFPSAAAVLRRELLEVDKIQLCLATSVDDKYVSEKLLSLLAAAKEKWALRDPNWYYENYSAGSTYENKNIVFVKRMLQSELPRKLRSTICHELFVEFVGQDVNCLAEELYMNLNQLIDMKMAGMHIGGHGDHHLRFSTLSEFESLSELRRTIIMLDTIEAQRKVRTFCCPHGDYDNTLMTQLAAQNFKAVFVANNKQFIEQAGNILIIPRIYPEDMLKGSKWM